MTIRVDKLSTESTKVANSPGTLFLTELYLLGACNLEFLRIDRTHSPSLIVASFRK